MGDLLRSVPPLFLLWFLLVQITAEPVVGDEVVLEGLVETSRAVLESDLAAWARFGFQRDVLRERLNEQGKVVWSRKYVFDVNPAAGGFDERLLEIDGRQPTPREIEEHRSAGRFQKHYREAIAAELGNPFGEDLPLLPLLFDQRHRYVGREVVAGVPCHRLIFDAREEPRGVPVPEKLKHAAKGTLCLSIEGTHLVEAEVESVRSVRKWPLRLNALSVRFESTRVDGAWVPRLFQTRSSVKIGPERLRKRNRYQYSDYHRR